MNIQYAILGLLSFKPLTGYDIKKIMQSSPVFHWSGNNSQIYRALAELQAEGFVESKVLHADASPTKKMYSLSEQGKRELSEMTRAYPQAPELRKPIMMQLAFGRDMYRQEAGTIMNQYEGEVRGAMLAGREVEKIPSGNTPLETAISEMIHESCKSFYESELRWIEDVKKNLLPLFNSEPINVTERRTNKMEYSTTRKNSQVYVTVTGGQIQSEQDGIALVSACAEHDTNLLLLPAESLSDDFLRLSSRIAGLVLQKLENYNIKAASILDTEHLPKRFQEFVSESNRGRVFRTFKNLADAELWLLGGKKA